MMHHAKSLSRPGTGSARRALPFVFINMAMTADGKIATSNRAISSFGSSRDREHLYELRASADAIMAGARTVDSNPVTLGPGSRRFRQQRLSLGLPEFPLRVIVSRSGSINPGAEIFKHHFSPIIILTTRRTGEKRLRQLQQMADAVYAENAEEINWRNALAYLRNTHGIKRLLCEGGGELNDALFQADLVDELNLTICPLLFGGRTAPTISDGQGSSSLAETTGLRLIKSELVGGELFCVFRRCPRRKR